MRNANKQRPTLKTIAEKLGIGVTTVSRALSDADDISIATKKRVREAADEVGYHRDLARVRLRTGRTGSISFILHPHDELVGYGSSLMQGLSRALANTDYQLNVIPDLLHEDQVKPIETLVRTRVSDGVIFSQTSAMDKRVRLLQEHNMPFISHGQTELATPHPFYDFDNRAFAYEGVKRLVERGCKKIILIGPPAEYLYSHHMQLGVMQAVNEIGIDASIIEHLFISSDTHSIAEWSKQLIKDNNAPDGIICGSETSAIAVTSGLAASGNNNIQVISKQTSQVLGLTQPEMETCFENIEITGYRLAQMLLQSIDGIKAENLQEIQQPVWSKARLAYHSPTQQ